MCAVTLLLIVNIAVSCLLLRKYHKSNSFIGFIFLALFIVYFIFRPTDILISFFFSGDFVPTLFWKTGFPYTLRDLCLPLCFSLIFISIVYFLTVFKWISFPRKQSLFPRPVPFKYLWITVTLFAGIILFSRIFYGTPLINSTFFLAILFYTNLIYADKWVPSEKIKYSVLFLCFAVIMAMASNERRQMLQLILPAVTLFFLRRKISILSGIFISSGFVFCALFISIVKFDFKTLTHYFMADNFNRFHKAFLNLTDFSIVYDDFIHSSWIIYSKELPMFEGITFLKVFFWFIPRTVWPGKPLDIDRLYVIKAFSENSLMSRPPTFLGEFFLNFGLTGIVVAGFFVYFILFSLSKLKAEKLPFSSHIYAVSGIFFVNFIRGGFSTNLRFLVISLFAILMLHLRFRNSRNLGFALGLMTLSILSFQFFLKM